MRFQVTRGTCGPRRPWRVLVPFTDATLWWREEARGGNGDDRQALESPQPFEIALLAFLHELDAPAQDAATRGNTREVNR